MTYLDAAILGIIQGLTEFLPISSSGHLVLSQELLGVNTQGVTFEVIVHVGTLLAILVYFRLRLLTLLKSLFDRNATQSRLYIGYLIVGTIPAAIIGLTLENYFEQAFASPVFTSAMLIVTGLVLLSTRLVKQHSKDVTWLTAVIIGIGQACAILPGISRSGTTISAGIHCKIDPAKAAEFSFLLALPAIGGAAILKSGEIFSQNSANIGPYLLAFVLAFASSLAATHWLFAIIKKGRFDWFAYYCFAAGAVGLYLFS